MISHLSWEDKRPQYVAIGYVFFNACGHFCTSASSPVNQCCRCHDQGRICWICSSKAL